MLLVKLQWIGKPESGWCNQNGKDVIYYFWSILIRKGNMKEVNTNPVTMLVFKLKKEKDLIELYRINPFLTKLDLYFLLARTYKRRSIGVGGVCVSHRLSYAICE